MGEIQKNGVRGGEWEANKKDFTIIQKMNFSISLKK